MTFVTRRIGAYECQAEPSGRRQQFQRVAGLRCSRSRSACERRRRVTGKLRYAAAIPALQVDHAHAISFSSSRVSRRAVTAVLRAPPPRAWAPPFTNR